MPPREQWAWGEHFEKFPFGDFYVQKILARFASMVAGALYGKPIHPRDFAEWLPWETREEELLREEMASHNFLIQQMRKQQKKNA